MIGNVTDRSSQFVILFRHQHCLPDPSPDPFHSDAAYCALEVVELPELKGQWEEMHSTESFFMPISRTAHIHPPTQWLLEWRKNGWVAHKFRQVSCNSLPPQSYAPPEPEEMEEVGCEIAFASGEIFPSMPGRRPLLVSCYSV